MIIQNAGVFDAEKGFVKKTLYLDGEKITEDVKAAEKDGQVLDAEGLMAIPALVDIHFHGCDGVDFCDGTEESIARIAAYELKSGIGAICPATMTFDEERIGRIADAAAAHVNGTGADLVGMNMEGPFISMKKKGAQNGAYIHKPDAEMFLRLQKRAGGLFRLCSLAPEEPGAMEFIEAVKNSTVVSVAHTCTDYETACEAFQRGASHVTHLYNAMPGLTHREPGPIAAAWENGASVELIADGIHIHPAMVRLAFSLFGDDRVVLISDSMMAAGLPDGDYELGGQAVTVNGSKAVLTDDPQTIAGSVTNLMNCMRTAVLSMGIPLESAVKAAACNPAKVIGVSDSYGNLTPGCFGNILLINDRLEMIYQIQRGKIMGGKNE
ncbi:MAG: N-acetylglucosamine-6-phosphate deacetylase [Lachnospiraceae bacterium]|nr:N-acetylglucosamine-6-phosphate deacetylase [Lachnospiraceae bacterium]